MNHGGTRVFNADDITSLRLIGHLSEVNSESSDCEDLDVADARAAAFWWRLPEPRFTPPQSRRSAGSSSPRCALPQIPAHFPSTPCGSRFQIQDHVFETGATIPTPIEINFSNTGCGRSSLHAMAVLFPVRTQVRKMRFTGRLPHRPAQQQTWQ
jgi:hypothetical protein